MPRPSDLPEFTNPPIVELVLSTQFATPAAYREVYARDVWTLFDAEFKSVQEHPALPPMFELFAGKASPAALIQFGLFAGPIRNRYWFLTDDQSQLIQFQQDRFIHNWRKLPRQAANQYPRFDTLLEKFERELQTLDRFYIAKGWGPIAANQFELTYVNQLPLLDPAGKEIPKSFYFGKLQVGLVGDPDEYSISLRQIVSDATNKPIARLFVEANTTDVDGKPFIGLNLTVRGAPSAPDYRSALRSLSDARTTIVKAFTAFTSPAAHKMWGRTQ